MHTRNLSVLLMGIIMLSLVACFGGKRKGQPKILVFSKTSGYYHESIPDGIAAIQKLGRAHGFQVDSAKDARLFTESNLNQYAAVVFLSTTGDVLDFEQEASFERYIQAGGGFVGIHAATDTEYEWPWYGMLVGAYFQSHPEIQDADYLIQDFTHPSTTHFTREVWNRRGELYNFKNMSPHVQVLMTADEGSYEGGENGDYHPMSWYHEYDGGRAFYTAVGHTKESFQEEEFLQHILGGIRYAIGENRKLDYAKTRTILPQEGDRFSKKALVSGGFTEPIEMTILPNHDILIAQRRGELLHWNAMYEELSEVGKLDVYWRTDAPDVNAEEGFMGLQKDPNYAENNWIYCFYSPAGDEWVNRLSRFKFVDGEFDKESEQVILDVPSDRDICCHTGGSIAFGPDDMLYLSTGDNSTPFDQPNSKYVNDGYAPLSDLNGDEQYDARRTSGNTNDLRGKILRIKVNEDGSYSIPEGNLFPEGTPRIRPEIYTMGHRNPYRISVDKKTGYVYWGDVGPDANEDKSNTRGPRGYDEVNQARAAGNFGWPFFIADNKPYRQYNYKTGESGPFYDPMKPINDSKNNTGLRELPPAQPAFLFYPYAESDVFQGLGTGSRNAMAGPVYNLDEYTGENTLPGYYDGKVIIYDWMRGWMKAVTLNDDGTVARYEPFAPQVELHNLIDMEIGSDGRIYLLEYGTGWWSTNEDSGLGYLEYNAGNRPPVVKRLIASTTSGQVPLNVDLSIAAEDPENSEMQYVWYLDGDNTVQTAENKLQYTFNDEGAYDVYVEVRDSEGASMRSESVQVIAGNTTPEVQIEITKGNSTFFIPGVEFQYKVAVSDVEDTMIDSSNIYVSVDYLKGFDEVSLSLGHQEATVKSQGLMLIESLDCKSCHQIDGKSIGPSYVQVSDKYKEDKNAIEYLSDKIKNGGGGVWGEVAMAAHPDLTADEAQAMAVYIKSLAGDIFKAPSLPLEGSITPKASAQNNVMVLTASYTDKGGQTVEPLTGIHTLKITGSTRSFAGVDNLEGFTPVNDDEMDLLILPQDGGWFALENIDMTGIGTINLVTGWQQLPTSQIEIQVRQESPEGSVIGTGKMLKPKEGQLSELIRIRLDKPVDGVMDKLYFTYLPVEEEKLSTDVALVNVTFGR